MNIKQNLTHTDTRDQPLLSSFAQQIGLLGVKKKHSPASNKNTTVWYKVCKLSCCRKSNINMRGNLQRLREAEALVPSINGPFHTHIHTHVLTHTETSCLSLMWIRPLRLCDLFVCIERAFIIEITNMKQGSKQDRKWER